MNPNDNAPAAEPPPAESKDRPDSSEFDPKYRHLRKEAAALLGASSADRCRFVHEDRYIVHERVKAVLADFKALLSRPPHQIRPECRAFVGGSNEGKSATVRRFLVDHGALPDELFAANESETPILSVEMPPRATEPRICLAIARALGLSGYSSSASRIVSDNVYRALVKKRVKLVFLNESQHVYRLPESERRIACDLIKGISNHGISVVAVGTTDVLALFSEDVQIANRMRVLRIGCFGRKDTQFDNFLATLESYYPLSEKSDLGTPRMSAEIYDRTNGICGEVVMLCNAAAARAIREGKPRIDLALLKTVQVLPPANAAA